MRETPRAKRAWADYLAMGPDRSLEALLKRYQNESKPLTTRLASLKKWSAQFGWQSRLQAIADAAAREAEEREAAYRREIMESGYALAHERIKALKGLAEVLHGELLQEDKRWLADVKQIGSGEGAERVDIERFNASEVEQFRGCLDDIAKELGERREVRVLAGDPKQPVVFKPARELTDDELAAIIAGGGAGTAGS